jgi:hypothetical protein
MNELPLPVGVVESEDADEFIRFWIADGDELVSLNVGRFGDDEAATWGMIVADLSIHIIRALGQRGAAKSDVELRAEIERGYRGRLEAKGITHSGGLMGTRN